jgi:hypothetical protein
MHSLTEKTRWRNDTQLIGVLGCELVRRIQNGRTRGSLGSRDKGAGASNQQGSNNSNLHGSTSGCTGKTKERERVVVAKMTMAQSLR